MQFQSTSPDPTDTSGGNGTPSGQSPESSWEEYGDQSIRSDHDWSSPHAWNATHAALHHPLPRSMLPTPAAGGHFPGPPTLSAPSGWPSSGPGWAPPAWAANPPAAYPPFEAPPPAAPLPAFPPGTTRDEILAVVVQLLQAVRPAASSAPLSPTSAAKVVQIAELLQEISAGPPAAPEPDNGHFPQFDAAHEPQHGQFPHFDGPATHLPPPGITGPTSQPSFGVMDDPCVAALGRTMPGRSPQAVFHHAPPGVSNQTNAASPVSTTATKTQDQWQSNAQDQWQAAATKTQDQWQEETKDASPPNKSRPVIMSIRALMANKQGTPEEQAPPETATPADTEPRSISPPEPQQAPQRGPSCPPDADVAIVAGLQGDWADASDSACSYTITGWWCERRLQSASRDVVGGFWLEYDAETQAVLRGEQTRLMLESVEGDEAVWVPSPHQQQSRRRRGAPKRLVWLRAGSAAAAAAGAK